MGARIVGALVLLWTAVFMVLAAAEMVYPGPQETRQLVQSILRSSAAVVVDGAPTCGGVVLAPRVVLTASHCVSSPQGLGVKGYAGSVIPARVLKASQGWDLAMVATDQDVGQGASLAPDVFPGDQVWTVGSPGGFEFFVSRGAVAGIKRYRSTPCIPTGRTYGDEDHQALYLDVRVFFGSSGGGVFSETGQLAGMVWAVRAATQGSCAAPVPYAGQYIIWGQAVGIDTIREFIR